ncbi:pyruvate dehydrogenase complex dihydrolipoamide acetyltransferase component (E2), partial [Blyttiomyces sp. JEL0837]
MIARQTVRAIASAASAATTVEAAATAAASVSPCVMARTASSSTTPLSSTGARVSPMHIQQRSFISNPRVVKVTLSKSAKLVRSYSTKSYPPHILLSFPALSPTMTQGNLGAWRKNVGDGVAPGDVLVEIETDKAQMDFECQEEGYVAKVFLSAGTKDPLCVLAENKEDIDKFADFTLDAAPAAPPKSADAPKAPVADAPTPVAAAGAAAESAAPAHDGRVLASPAARFIAASKGIPLEHIKGTGPHGRIVKADVESYKVAPDASAASASPTTTSSFPAYVPAPVTAQAYEDIPLSNVRKVIASRLTESKQAIPHYYLTLELNAEEILKIRETLNKQSDGRYKLSVNDFVIKAASLALRDVPAVNSAWQGTFIREYKTSDIAVAVATENGLITPIVTNADGKGLSTISNTVKELAEKARDGKLAPHEYQGGSFTISNLGMFGIQSFTAIINPPHAAILAVGGVEDKLVLDDKSERGFRSQKTFKVTLSCDHRVVDGAVGAKWLQRFKGYVENPLSALETIKPLITSPNLWTIQLRYNKSSSSKLLIQTFDICAKHNVDVTDLSISSNNASIQTLAISVLTQNIEFFDVLLQLDHVEVQLSWVSLDGAAHGCISSKGSTESIFNETITLDTENVYPYVLTVLCQSGIRSSILSEAIEYLSSQNVVINTATTLSSGSIETKTSFKAIEFKVDVRSNNNGGDVDTYLKGLRTELFLMGTKGGKLDAKTDMTLLKDNVFRRHKKLVVFDMDSTLIQQEVIDEIA